MSSYHGCLSSSDFSQLNKIAMTLSSNKGDFLVPCNDESFTLVVLNSDGSIPSNAITPFNASLDEIMSFCEGLLPEQYKSAYIMKNQRKKLSAGLSELLWPSDEGETQVEFRSPVPGFPPRGQLRVVLSNVRGFGQRKRKTGDEYCLAAGKDGTVKWLPESECVDKIHVWTVNLFERRAGEVLYLRDQLRRTEPYVYNNCSFNIIGGNVNGSGNQNIGSVNSNVPGNVTNQLPGFRNLYQLMQKYI